jgi:hypothetical protein
MSKDTCDPCCSPVEFSRANESFKAAVLILLCKLLAKLVDLNSAAIGIGGPGGGPTEDPP